MKALLIHQAFASPQEAGGTRHYELAQHCRRSGHALTIVASDLSYLTGGKLISGGGLIHEQIVDGVRVLRARTAATLHRSFAWRVFAFFSFMLSSAWAGLRAGPVDVVMGTSPPIFQAVSAWLVAALRRKPFLLEIRDLWPEFAIDIGILTNPVLIALSRWLERFLYRHADHLLVNSPAYRDYLISKGLAPAKISLIANGVDPEMFDPAATGQEVRDQFKLDAKFVVVYAGAIGLANDIPTILHAALRLREHLGIHFLLVGDGKERPNMERLSRDLGLTNVTFTGPLPKTQMKGVLAAADACVASLKNIPMFRLTYPNKVFDYMAAGRPTVLAIDGVIRKVIEKAQAGIFAAPGDPAALAEAVLQLQRDPQSAREMGRRGRAYVVEHFNRHRQAPEFVRLLERLRQPRPA
jgi:glycosyltransferase involved in cell wall biosynthesis